MRPPIIPRPTRARLGAMTDRDQEEQNLRIEVMGAVLEQIRATVDRIEAETQRERRMDTAAAKQAEAEAKRRAKSDRIELWKVLLTAFGAFGAAFSGGAAALALLLHWLGKL
jgi:hypothetical protein